MKLELVEEAAISSGAVLSHTSTIGEPAQERMPLYQIGAKMTAHQALGVVVATAQRRAGAGDEPLVAMRTAMNAVPLAVLIADDNGHYIRTNAAASALTGYSAAELRRLFVWDLTPNPSKDEFETLWRAFLAHGEQHGRYQLATKGGRVLTADYAARAHVLPHLHVSVLRRLTDRRSVRRA